MYSMRSTLISVSKFNLSDTSQAAIRTGEVVKEHKVNKINQFQYI